jgi:hypothetical protein
MNLRPFTPLLLCPILMLAGCTDSNEEGGLPALLQIRTGGELIFGHPQDDCAECHAQHVKEWEMGPHAYATADPVFHAMTRLGQKQSNGKLGQFCIQCHSPVALATNAAPVYQDAEGIYRQDTENLDRLSQTGVSCDVCHSITDVLEPVNARAILTPNGIRRATIKDPVETPAHGSEYSELHEKSDLCGMCHAVDNPKGAPLEQTFPEWEASSFAQPGGKTCQDCHMLPYQGVAAKDGKIREVHRHHFVGVDVSLLPPDEFPGYEELRELSANLLKESANVTVEFQDVDRKVRIEVQNLAGHALPSGATAERQMWIELVVKDAQGTVVFETGTLDENGDLRDSNPKHTTQPGTDPQLILWNQQMVNDPTRQDPNSTAPITPVTFPWQASWIQDKLIAADGTDTEYVDLSALPSGTYSADLRLRFRTFPMYFLVILEAPDTGNLDPDVKTRVPIVDMYTTQLPPIVIP